MEMVLLIERKRQFAVQHIINNNLVLVVVGTLLQGKIFLPCPSYIIFILWQSKLLPYIGHSQCHLLTYMIFFRHEYSNNPDHMLIKKQRTTKLTYVIRKLMTGF